MKKVAVLFTIFNRRNVSVEAFQCIKEYKPERLYIAADGPRAHKQGEDLKCEDTRKAVLDEINWPCEVKTLFRDENLGCAQAMYGAISWFFEQEEWGVIIEDDVIVSQDFFKVCEELLPRYAHEEKIMEISAQNYTPMYSETDSFVFTNSIYCWGWASWRRAWEKMDMQLSFWPQITRRYLIRQFGIVQGLHTYSHGSKAFKSIQALNSWAFRWHLSIMYNNGVVMLAKTNLSKNIGNTTEGAHYESGEEDLYQHLTIGKMLFPLVLPKDICISREQQNAERKDFIRIRIHGLKKKLKKL
ncbi:MAG: hypothetical protein J5630_06390 [Bacteroidaceae bacterium]|nr:hypothetical protein [Bacteroidaceae bacterium]